ncbi:MAG: hypothetical protein ACRED9_08010 [Caulobacteraceae bacterium]
MRAALGEDHENCTLPNLAQAINSGRVRLRGKYDSPEGVDAALKEILISASETIVTDLDPYSEVGRLSFWDPSIAISRRRNYREVDIDEVSLGQYARELLAPHTSGPVSPNRSSAFPMRRKHGGWDYRKADEPFVEQMQKLIEGKDALSRFEAAKKVSEHAPGYGT